jgi:hypothetical protein
MRNEGVTVATFADGVHLEIGPAPAPAAPENTLTVAETRARQREQEAERERLMFAAVGGPVRRAEAE